MKILITTENKNKFRIWNHDESRNENYPTKSSLITDAIRILIEGADLDLWEKGKDEIQPEKFFNVLLEEIALSYFIRVPSLPNELSTFEILRLMINDLHEQGYLRETLKFEES